MGGCLFKTGYTLYANTCVGRCVHNRCLAHYKKTYGERAVHSNTVPFLFDDLLILPVPFLSNNYTYVIADLQGSNFVFVDVGDATRLAKLDTPPDAILTTHRHWDHSYGNKEMKAAFPDIKIYGGEIDNVPNVTHSVKDGEVVEFGRLRFTALLTPGHTRGHIVWRLSGEPFNVQDSVFTGDHLMLASCGAVFEGNLETMVTSLDLMRELPEDTLVWPGHEVGLESLELAAFVEPDNMAALAKLIWAIKCRDSLRCTCPSTIGEEKQYNPFLRTGEVSLQTSLGLRHRLTEDQINNHQLKVRTWCFYWIIHKTRDLSKLKRYMSIQEKKRKGDKKKAEGKESDSSCSPNPPLIIAPGGVLCRTEDEVGTTSRKIRQATRTRVDRMQQTEESGAAGLQKRANGNNTRDAGIASIAITSLKDNKVVMSVASNKDTKELPSGNFEKVSKG